MSSDRLVSYPYIKVRISCALCQRCGSYRLARLAEHFGAEIELEALLTRLVACPARLPDIPYIASVRPDSRTSTRRFARQTSPLQ